MASQVAESQFSAAGQGHKFELRQPLAKVTARKCRVCSESIFDHARREVSDDDLRTVLDLVADDRASVIDGRLLVGGFKAMIAECARDARTVACNCAGTRLHDFLPKTRAPADQLRAAGRLLDLEWDDDDGFVLELAAIARALRWIARALADGETRVVINCAQGKSRSGTFACAYLMATRDLDVASALAMVRAKRPFVQPNSGFINFLIGLERSLFGTNSCTAVDFGYAADSGELCGAPPPTPMRR